MNCEKHQKRDGAQQRVKLKIRKLNGKQVNVFPSEYVTDLTREYDIRFYTGLINQDIFRTLFEFLKIKASTMTYGNGNKRKHYQKQFLRIQPGKCIIKVRN